MNSATMSGGSGSSRELSPQIGGEKSFRLLNSCLGKQPSSLAGLRDYTHQSDAIAALRALHISSCDRAHHYRLYLGVGNGDVGASPRLLTRADDSQTISWNSLLRFAARMLVDHIKILQLRGLASTTLCKILMWLRGPDLNRRPSGYEQVLSRWCA